MGGLANGVGHLRCSRRGLWLRGGLLAPARMLRRGVWCSRVATCEAAVSRLAAADTEQAGRVAQVLARRGIDTPRPVQAACWPLLMAGKHVHRAERGRAANHDDVE